MIGLLSLAAVAQAAQTSAENLGDRAAQSFAQVCLANRANGPDTAIASIRAIPGVAEQPSLPLGNKKLRLFVAGDLEYLVRPEKLGFGCFVAFKGDATQSDRAVAAIGVLAGLSPRPRKAKGKPSFEWMIEGTKDLVRLVPDSDIGGVLINLEAVGEVK